MIGELMAPQGWIAILSVWILFFWLYRDYRLDLFRERMFALRDELFDLADSGALSFDSNAYGMLRSMINGNIQFGHQLGFFEFVVVFLSRGRNLSKSRFEETWEIACRSLPVETIKRLNMVRSRMHLLVFDQLVFTSFILMITLIALLLAVLMLIAKKAMSRSIERIVQNLTVSQFLTQLECAASIGPYGQGLGSRDG